MLGKEFGWQMCSSSFTWKVPAPGEDLHDRGCSAANNWQDMKAHILLRIIIMVFSSSHKRIKRAPRGPACWADLSQAQTTKVDLRVCPS